MTKAIKNQSAILEKLGIKALSPMQIEAKATIHAQSDIVLLSPTGTGKTLAFLLPILSELDRDKRAVQALILAPSRELAIQIEQVAREMGTGHKIYTAYGGTSFSKDKTAFKNPPSILIGTPGRIADHIKRETLDVSDIRVLILDEFDKSLEVGFEVEMSNIFAAIPNLRKRILTSATQEVTIPAFVGLSRPTYVNYLGDKIASLSIKRVLSPEKDKMETLFQTLCHLGNQPGIVFCNYKDSIQRISKFLSRKGINHGCFYGGMEQRERERALIKFRNGTHQLIIATDLAARGIDILELKYIIHYHLPQRPQDFTHRNGRTARMHNEGTAYVLQWTEELLPDFIETREIEKVLEAPLPTPSPWKTLFISGGRQDKISKGDVAGLFFRKGDLPNGTLGRIELKQDCAFVAVPSEHSERLIDILDGIKLKKRKIRVMEI